MDTPKTAYAKSGNINLAYQVLGAGEEYLILIPGWVSNVEEAWNVPQLSAWLWYLASFGKLVIFDKRGTGLSDMVNANDLPDTEQRAEDLRIIMSTIGIEKANFIGISEGGPLAVYLAAHYPDLVSKLILIGSFSKWIRTKDYPYGRTLEQHQASKHYIFEHWGKPVGLNLMAPSVQDDEVAQNQWAKFLRRSASPGTARTFYEMNTKIDVRDYLGKVAAPTLIMHRKGDALIEYGHSQYMHSEIPNSQLLLIEGKDHLPWFSVKRRELIGMQTFLQEGRATNNPKLEILTVKDIFVLYQIRDYLGRNFQEKMSISHLSRKFGINEYKMKSGFRLLFRSPVITMLTDIRLKHACRLLERPEETVSSVAEQVGYTHSNNFSAAFKRKYRLTPLQYRTKVGGL